MSFKKIRKLKYEFLTFVLFVLSRLPALGRDIFNTDVWKWKQRIYDFGTGVFYLDFAKTIQRYHPGVTLMWIGSFAVKVYNLFFRVFTGSNPPDDLIEVVFGLHFTQKLFVVLVIGLVLTSIFYCLRKMFGLKYAVVTTALLALEPFYIALTRVIHLEGLMTTFLFASFVWLYYFLNVSGKRIHYYFAVAFTSFAVLTKTSALFVLPFIGILLFVYKYIRSKKFIKSLSWSLIMYVEWLVVGVLIFMAVWPAMWTNASEAIAILYRGIFTIGVERGHVQLFLGNWVENPGLLFYPVVFLYRSSLYVVAGLVGFFFIFKRLEISQKKFALYGLLFSILYLIGLSIPSKKLDRYLLPTVVFMIPATSFFVLYAVDYIKERFNKSKWYIAALVVFVPSLITAGILHPDYFSYYSLLGGGLRYGINAVEPKWVIGQHKLIEYLEYKKDELNLVSFAQGESLHNQGSKLENKLVVAFPEKYYTQLYPFVKEIGGWATIDSIKLESRKSQFFIYPVWFDSTDSKDKRDFLEQIYLRGVPIYNVYTNRERIVND